MRRSLWALLLCTAGCRDSFENEGTLVLEGSDACVAGSDGYWPPLYAVWAAMRFDPPEAPYEVRTVSVDMWTRPDGFDGVDCSATAPVDLLFFVHSATDATAFNGDPEPDWAPLAMQRSSGVDGEDYSVSPVTWTLDEPVLVERTGYLWVGYHPATLDSDPIACLAGCTHLQENDNTYIWDNMRSEFLEIESSHARARVAFGY